MLRIVRPLWARGAAVALFLTLFAVFAVRPAEPHDAATAASSVLLAAGDVASCDWNGDEETAAVIQSQPGYVAMLGDAAYPEGSADAFAQCYGASWGQFKNRTFPAAGNHDYAGPPASGGADSFFVYFGRRASPPRGYYAYRLGTWKIIVLNNNCASVGGCGRGSDQELWLRRQLRTSTALCTLAYWHEPRFTSGSVGGNADVSTFWGDLYAAGADVVLNGHAHSYERFAPQTSGGRLDRRFGIREFVVGTGGAPLHPFTTRLPNTEVRNNTTWGVLRLDLRRGSYRWRFLPAGGGQFTDSGRAFCHGRPSGR